MSPPAKVQIENVLQPGKTYSADAAKYEAMRRVYLSILPAAAPGLTADEVREAVVPLLPQDLFPGGATAGWWCKAIQLDLEAKGLVVRGGKPLRLRKA